MRLPNGNTLSAEGFFGRMFQVTPEGEAVWEYTNPYHTSQTGRWASATPCFAQNTIRRER